VTSMPMTLTSWACQAACQTRGPARCRPTVGAPSVATRLANRRFSPQIRCVLPRDGSSSNAVRSSEVARCCQKPSGNAFAQLRTGSPSESGSITGIVVDLCQSVARPRRSFAGRCRSAAYQLPEVARPSSRLPTGLPVDRAAITRRLTNLCETDDGDDEPAEPPPYYCVPLACDCSTASQDQTLARNRRDSWTR
jgi:hypothetical protein